MLCALLGATCYVVALGPALPGTSDCVDALESVAAVCGGACAFSLLAAFVAKLKPRPPELPPARSIERD